MMKSFSTLFSVAILSVLVLCLTVSAIPAKGDYGKGDYGKGDYGKGDYGKGDHGKGGLRCQQVCYQSPVKCTAGWHNRIIGRCHTCCETSYYHGYEGKEAEHGNHFKADSVEYVDAERIVADEQ
jgi:hypothetical protein